MESNPTASERSRPAHQDDVSYTGMIRATKAELYIVKQPPHMFLIDIGGRALMRSCR